MSAPVSAGQVVKGKYLIDRVIGEGGMGVVVAARHVALDQRFAIKFLRPAMLTHPEVVERFAREARAASKIESDHVARVIDVDTLEDGTPFMVMEFLDGNDLSSVRRANRPLPPHVVASYALEACEALAEAHRLGIVHRDLKPANLFVTRRAGGRTRVKVLDFGISKIGGPSVGGPSVTTTSMVMGSAEYMSPEQMLSARDVDARSDIWSMGVTLYELLTAAVPFPGETITQVCALVMAYPPPPPSTHVELDADLERVVLRCLEKDPANRFASIDELAAALAPFTAGAEYVVERASPANDLASKTAVLPASDPGLAPPTPRTRLAEPAAAVVTRPVSVALAAAPPTAGTMAAVSSGPVAPPPKTSRAPLLLGASLVLILGVAAAALGLRSGATTPAVGVSSDAAVPLEVVSATAPVVAPADEAPASPDIAPADTPITIASSPPSAAPVKPTQHRVAPPPPVRATPKVNCTPPFTIDSNGVKHAKPECT